ncbi:MAG: 50S ribosomal protein L3, partial [bacterium]|nr:50S ribosomal protein L3 [bacterium]
NKPSMGQLEKAGVKTPLHFLREIRLERMKDMVKSVEENGKKGIALGETKIFIGDTIQPNLVFKKGDFIDAAGISKGKGFQGVVKRHGFAGGPKTHGQSDRHRAPGSMGQTTTPGRVYRGKRMAGRMGTERVTIQNLEVIEVREDGIKVKGLIPGHKESLIEVRTSII